MDETGERLGAVDERLEALTAAADRFGTVMTGALRSAVVEGRSLEDVLKRVALQLSASVLDEALKPLSRAIGGLAGDLVGSLADVAGTGAAGAASGRAFTGGAGGAGSAEAGPRTTVVVNVTTPDADSFRRSEAQLGGMLARAVGRGRRGL